ncbi:DMT family transporter [Rhodosalinus sp. 5P4]|uniref:DMT family transporter n=1 Tax=Rhodosalinus sp. 5P4 TaxID=3239196 RepID=UPI0035236BBE
MERKAGIDAAGAAMLVGFSLLLAVNQVIIKLTNDGFQPVFAAGLRSAGAVLVLLFWMRLRGIPLSLPRESWAGGVLVGGLFAVEFTALFLALDRTTVARAGIVFYSMPVWLALAAHVLLPGERLDGRRLAELALALAGVAVALADRGGGQASLAGDLLALAGALGWAGIALTVRLSALSRQRPEMQLFWQLAVSVPLLLALAPLFGPLLRDPGPEHLAGLAFQILAIASAGFLFWFWLISVYPASGVASFSFLAPVFSVLLGWALLAEPVGPSILAALALVAAGLWLVNRPRGPVAG